VQEAALTGESAPIAKDRVTLPEIEIALGDRTNLVSRTPRSPAARQRSS
jgi:P-type Ca2+ transporter type 2C